MVPAARRPLVFSLLAIVLIAAFVLQSYLASRVKSPCFDETGDIAAGLSYWRTGKFTVNLQHPPLLKELSGLFTLATGAQWPDTAEARQLLAGWSQYQWSVGSDIIRRYGQEQVMFWARLPMILVAAGLGIVLYLWGCRMLGAGAGLGALFLFAFDPTMLAHSYLVTLDVGLAAFTVLFCFALWSYLQDPGPQRMLLCGAAMGAMLSTKFSAPVVVPIAGLLLFLAVCKPPAQALGRIYRFFNLYSAAAEPKTKAGPNDPCPCGSGKKFKKCHGAAGQMQPSGSGLTRKLMISIGAFLALCLVAGIVVEATYFFSTDPFLYLRAMRLVNQDHDANYLYYLAGNLSPRFLSYFAAAWLLKEPLATIALVIVGLVTMVRSTRLTLLEKLLLTLPPAALFIAHTFLADNLGIRYIIVCMAFGYLIGGIGLAELLASAAAWKRGLAAVLCVWVVVAAIGIYPDHLSYFNESACLLTHPGEIGLDGGSRCGTYWLEDSNVDWGEGLKQLKAWLDRHAPGRKISLSYMGSYPPANYGLVFDDIGLEGLLPEPKPGLYAVSAHMLIRAFTAGQMEHNQSGAWLRRIPPTALVGHCMYIYDIPGK